MDKKIDAQALETHWVKVLKLTPEEVARLYNEAGELTNFELIEQKDAERIAKINKVNTDQRGKLFKDGAESVEKAIREKYDVDPEVKLIGVELFDHVVETKIADIKGADAGDILKNPEVIKLVNQHSKALKDKDKEIADKLKAKEDEINAANLFKEIETNALVEFENLNPILPEDAKKAQALKAILVSELKKNKYQKDGEQFVVLKEDGTPLQNEHGYNVSFADHVKGNAERYFDFKVAEPRNSPGNKPPTGTPPSVKVRLPKDKDDFVKMMQDQTLTPQERIGINNLWVNKK